MTAPRNILRNFLLASSIALAVPLSAPAEPLGDGPDGRVERRHQGMPGGPGAFLGGERLPQHLRELKLTEEQQDKVFEIMHAQAPALRERAKELRKARQELRQLAMSPQYDEARAQALAETAARSMAELSRLAARGANQVYQLLTPEQKGRLEARKARLDSRADASLDELAEIHRLRV